MSKWFSFNMTDFLAIILTSIGIYIAIIIFTRLAGKRSFSKMSSFDFAITVALGSIVATTVVSKSVSLWEGILGLAMMYALQLGLAILRRYRMVRDITDNPPMFLMKGKSILYDNLKKCRVTEDDLRSKLREANVLKLDQVRAVIFEATGDISVLHASDSTIEIEDWIIKNVES